MATLGSLVVNIRTNNAQFNRGIKSANSGLASMKKSAIGAKTAIAGLVAAVGVGRLAKLFLEAANTTEQFRVRLKTLLGSAAEGNRLFRNMAEFAGKVPFEFENVMQSATRLSTVMKGGVDEVTRYMPIIADLAAASGLTIEQTADQFARAWVAGAGAADLFRDRGVNAMLGFKAGATVTAKEFRATVVEEWEKVGSQFKGASNDLAKTWSGTMSMIGDKWFQFRTVVMESGPFDMIKALAVTIDEDMGNALGKTKADAEAWGQTFVNIINSMIKSIPHVIQAFKGIQLVIKVIEMGFRGFGLLVATVMRTIAVSSAIILRDISKGVEIFNKELAISMRLAAFAAETAGDMFVQKMAAGVEESKNEVVLLSMELAKGPGDGGKWAAFFERVQSKYQQFRREREASNNATGGTRIVEQAEQDIKAIDKIRTAALSVLPTYELMVEAAQKWRTDSLASLDASAKDYDKWASLVERIFNEKIKKAYLADLENKKDWLSGAKLAFENLKAELEDVGGAVAASTKKVFQGIEDALVDFVTTGKLSIKDLVQTIEAEIARLTVRQAIIKPLNNWFGEILAGGGVGDLDFFASGTNFAPGGLAVVGEKGPELVNLPRGSQVIPNDKIGGGGTNIFNFTVQGQTDRRSQQQIADAAYRGVTRANSRNG